MQAVVQPRISFITLGVSDLARSRRFYEQGLGWQPSSSSNDCVAFFQLSGGLAFALFPRTELAKDACITDTGHAQAMLRLQRQRL